MKWHELRLDELLCLASSKPIHELHRLGEPLPRALESGPPPAEQQQELVDYVLTVWCPWFSREFGSVDEACVFRLTRRMLQLHTHESSICWSTVIAATSLLVTHNQPLAPLCSDNTLGPRFLFSTD